MNINFNQNNPQSNINLNNSEQYLSSNSSVSEFENSEEMMDDEDDYEARILQKRRECIEELNEFQYKNCSKFLERKEE
jgi:hypothetical protein